MRKFLVLIFSAFLCVFNAFASREEYKEGDHMPKNLNVLIAYFSWGGNTESVAEEIKKYTNGDVFKIETVTPYPTDYKQVAYGVGKKQCENGEKPELKGDIDLSKYDVIFLGTPVWWSDMAPAVKTFLSKGDFKGKIIYPFITHGGGGQGKIEQNIRDMAIGAKKVLQPLVIQGKVNKATIGKLLHNWIME